MILMQNYLVSVILQNEMVMWGHFVIASVSLVRWCLLLHNVQDGGRRQERGGDTLWLKNIYSDVENATFYDEILYERILVVCKERNFVNNTLNILPAWMLKKISYKLFVLNLVLETMCVFFIVYVTTSTDSRLWSSDTILSYTTVETSNPTSVGEFTICCFS